jgi:hypothetical protein
MRLAAIVGASCLCLGGEAGAQSPLAASMVQDSILEETTAWLRENLPRLSRVRARVGIEPRRSAGWGPYRTWVVAADLDSCSLTIQRIFDANSWGPASQVRITHRIPLQNADPESLALQRHDPPRNLTVPADGQHPWRLILAMEHGAITTDIDGLAGARRTTLDPDLDLIVQNEEAGVRIGRHLEDAIRACRRLDEG